MLSKRSKLFFFLFFLTLSLVASWKLLKESLPVNQKTTHADFSSYPSPEILKKDPSRHDLSIIHYRQIGREIHLLPFSNSPNLSPFLVEFSQDGEIQTQIKLSSGPGSWLCFSPPHLATSPFTLTLRSLQDTTCHVQVQLEYDQHQASEIADTSKWFRHGSNDDFLDVRVLEKNGKYYLRDYSNYQDGRTRVYFLEGMIVEGLEKGIEIKPGYLYSVAARWIDGDYAHWWNKSKNRTSRLQTVWVEPDTTKVNEAGETRLAKVQFPEWFRPSRSFNPTFDTSFPKFQPVKDKLVMTYRLNQEVPVTSYFERGVTHLSRWEADAPPLNQHWTEAPGFFGDKDHNWFSTLEKSEVEEYADRVGKIGAYAFDFEFWNRQYTPKVKQRLLWFSKRLKENNPDLFLFDYWGGSAYHNTTFQDKNGTFSPLGFVGDYQSPTSNHYNFEKLPDGDFFGKYFNITTVDVYPRPPLLVGRQSNVLNNYLVLSAVHASRINKLFDFQKQNKTIWFAWNRFMPLYDDPPFPWSVATSSPKGTLVFNGLETTPASQSLALSLFSLIEGDGYYLWSDSRPWGKGENNYQINDNTTLHGATGWWPLDGKSSASQFQLTKDSNESPRYWDYPSDYFALGNWIVKTHEQILTGGKRQDLAFFSDGKWQIPQKEQALLAAQHLQPFVTSVVNGNKILILALDSFQPPNQTKKLNVKLPDNTEAQIEMYGNWPSVYTGNLQSVQ